uniref:(northern house mosquito) hypothetical protein n=1 Tax=Culex pipiens TaxID=7175 RepID=A0A8D8D0T8_CULPI
MVSHAVFKILGYSYAFFGILGSILGVVSSVVLIEVDAVNKPSNSYYYQNISSSFVMLVFFLMLFAGIYHKNIVFVKIYKVFLIISSILIQLVLVAYIGFTIFYEQKTENSASFLLALIVGLAIFTGLFLLFLWIVNGVIGYIEYGAVLNAAEPGLTDEDDQKMKVKYEAVLTRF